MNMKKIIITEQQEEKLLEHFILEKDIPLCVALLLCFSHLLCIMEIDPNQLVKI